VIDDSTVREGGDVCEGKWCHVFVSSVASQSKFHFSKGFQLLKTNI
jgi:hypothetical protein